MTQQQAIEELQQRMKAMEVEIQELKAKEPRRRLGNPWARMAGMFANDPLQEEWREAMTEYRSQVDAEEEASKT